LEKILLEYDQCHCGKLNKKVTITSMVIKDSNWDAASGRDGRRALDCNQKEQCGVLTNSENEIVIDWFECSHPKFTGGGGSCYKHCFS
jgi:hypothetical protein